jgi:4-amino-4-deoxy-L-arabinose transferase-like glycosyltransferase
MPMSRRARLFLAAAITLLAAFLRLYRIDVLPPGETYDPAYYGLDALAILRGERPVFIETNYGREPLFSYLVAACVAVLGIGPQAIHVASAIVGILTVPAVYLAAEEAFREDQGLLGRFGAPVAALATALSRWHLFWSRYGVRAILTPLFAAVTVYFLWRGLRTRRWSAFALCGFFLGLGMYTYQATRLLPVLIVIGFAHAAWANRSLSRSDIGRLALVVLVSLVVFAPLGYYAVTHPDSFSERMDQVFVLENAEARAVLEGLVQGLKKTLLVFSFRGDDQPTINLPGRPALDLFLSTAFALGIIISLARIRQPIFFLLLAWLGVMSVPGVLAQHGPTAKRVIGTLPAVMMLVAVGTMVPLNALRRWAVRASRTRLNALRTVSVAALALLIAAGLAYSGAVTYHDYFIAWGQDPALFTHFEAGLAAIGQYIRQRPRDEQIYVSPVYAGHPSILYNSGEHPEIKGYHGDYCIVLPDEADHDTTYIVVPGEDRRSTDLLQEYLPQGEIVSLGPLHYGQPYYIAYKVPPETHVQVAPTWPLHVNWDDQIELLGYDVVPNQAEGTLRIRLYYRALGRIGTDYTVFLQLVGPHNPATDSPLWSQRDSEPCRRYRPTSTWAEDEILIDDFALAIPPNLPQGEEYELIVGFYDWRTLERLPTLSTDGQALSDHAVLPAWPSLSR